MSGMGDGHPTWSPRAQKQDETAIRSERDKQEAGDLALNQVVNRLELG